MGSFFNSSAHRVATLFPEEPYGELFYGKVVDMFYFPFIENATLPEWIPFVGGDNFTFFQYIFNPADAFISVGVVLLFLYSKKGVSKRRDNHIVMLLELKSICKVANFDRCGHRQF